MDNQLKTLSPFHARKLMKWGVATAPIYSDATQFSDIELVQGPDGTLDLAVSAGLENLTQQITAAIVTALGSDPLNVVYGFMGFQILAEETDPVMRREKLRFAVLGVLEADPRILRVERVLIGDEILIFRGLPVERDPMHAATTPHGEGSRYPELDIEAQFQVRPGETLTVTLGAPGAEGVL